jgi:S1-C subfamily serine protease
VESQAQPGEGTSTRLKVCAVAPGSPAAQAGLEPEDRIVALAGKPVPFKDHRAALSYFGRLEVGQRVRLGVLREAESIEVELTAGPLPPGMREVRRRNLELSRESPADPPRH